MFAGVRLVDQIQAVDEITRLWEVFGVVLSRDSDD